MGTAICWLVRTRFHIDLHVLALAAAFFSFCNDSTVNRLRKNGWPRTRAVAHHMKQRLPNCQHSYSKLAMRLQGAEWAKKAADCKRRKLGSDGYWSRAALAQLVAVPSVWFCLRCGEEIRILIKQTFASVQRQQTTKICSFQLIPLTKQPTACTKEATVPVCNQPGHYTGNKHKKIKVAFGHSKTTNHGQPTMCVL